MADQAIDGLLQRLTATLEQQQQTRKRLGKIRQALTIAFVLVLIGFLCAIYARITSMYTAEKINPPLQQELQRVTPKVLAATQDVLQAVAPVYIEQGRKRLEAIQPRLENIINHEVDTLALSISEKTRYELIKGLERINNGAVQRYSTKFPSLNDPMATLHMKQRWEKAIKDDHEVLAQLVLDKYGTDLQPLRETLEKFRPSKFEQYDRLRLTWYYIHLWLALADRQIMAEVEGKNHGK